MDIKTYLAADERIKSALQRLILESSKEDGYTSDLDLDTSMNAVKDMRSIFACEENGQLTGLLFVFAPGREDIEINALVHPGFRSRGCFKALLREAVEECSRFGYKQGLFVVNSASKDGKAVMQHWSCGTDHVELQMECGVTPAVNAERTDIEIVEATTGDIEELADLGAAAFNMDREFERGPIQNALAGGNRTQYALKRGGRFAAMCAACEADGKMMIFGLGVHPDERRKGYGKALLDHIANIARQHGITRLALDVDEDNEGARTLYESYGFVKTGRTEYRTFYFDGLK